MPQLVITIPTDKVAKMEEGFLEQWPKPASFNGTVLEWGEAVLAHILDDIVKQGLRDKAHREATVEESYTE